MGILQEETRKEHEQLKLFYQFVLYDKKVETFFYHFNWYVPEVWEKPQIFYLGEKTKHTVDGGSLEGIIKTDILLGCFL